MCTAVRLSPPPPLFEGYRLSLHAHERMRSRGLPLDALRAALLYGRMVHVRDADTFVIGRREIRHHEKEGLDLSAYEGVHVVCHESGLVLTVYRNRDLRGLRPRFRRPHRRQRHNP